MIALSEENPSVVSDPESALYDPLSPYYDEDLDPSATPPDEPPAAASPVVVAGRGGDVDDTDANAEEIDVGEDTESETTPEPPPPAPPPTPFLQRREPVFGLQVWQVGLATGLAALLLGALAALLGGRRR